MSEDPTLLALIECVRDNPFSAPDRGVLADYIGERGDEKREALLRAGNIPLTGIDEVAAFELGQCRFAPATFDKRFAKQIAAAAVIQPPSLTPKQWLWMWVLLHRYRRSVRNQTIKDLAEKRYDRCVELLDIGWLKPIDRRLTNGRKGHHNMQSNLFDEE